MCSFEVVVVRSCADESVGGVVCEYVYLKVFSDETYICVHSELHNLGILSPNHQTFEPEEVGARLSPIIWS